MNAEVKRAIIKTTSTYPRLCKRRRSCIGPLNLLNELVVLGEPADVLICFTANGETKGRDDKTRALIFVFASLVAATKYKTIKDVDK